MDIVERLRQEIDGYTDRDVEKAEANMQEAADEIERLREQVEFERASLQSAFGELKKLDGDIERLREALQWAIKDCDAKTNHESIKRELLEALEGK